MFNGDRYTRCVVAYGKDRSDRYGHVITYTTGGDVRVRYDSGIEVTCRRECVLHPDTRQPVMPDAWAALLDSMSRPPQFVQ